MEGSTRRRLGGCVSWGCVRVLRREGVGSTVERRGHLGDESLRMILLRRFARLGNSGVLGLLDILGVLLLDSVMV